MVFLLVVSAATLVRICQGRKIGRCDQPRIDAGKVDEAVRSMFVEQFVDQVDVQRTIEAQRDRLIQAKSGEAQLLRETITEVETDVRTAERFLRTLKSDYGSGVITGDQYAELQPELKQRITEGNVMLDTLRASLERAEDGVGVSDIDAMLDHLDSLVRTLSGRLSAEDVAPLNEQLHTVFDRFEVSVQGDRIIVDPHLRPEWTPEGVWTTIDFGSNDHDGATVVEVTEYLGAVMRRVDLR